MAPTPRSPSADALQPAAPAPAAGPARPSRRRGLAALATVSGAAAVVLAVVVALLAYRLGSAGAAADAEDAPAATATTSAAPTVTDVYETVAASVVVVRTADGSLGSGVVAADDGTILTANHVIADGSAVTVTFADGTESTATVSATDATTDIASLLPATLPEVLVPATIGGGVEVGATVIAIGNPLQLTLSLSTGVVSGLERSGETAAGEIDGLIQFDASVNAGSSGGPLLDETGTVVGIVVAIADPGEDGAFAGIGFAVPIAAAVDGGTGGQGPQL